jgi:hypothetical protein
MDQPSWVEAKEEVACPLATISYLHVTEQALQNVIFLFFPGHSSLSPQKYLSLRLLPNSSSEALWLVTQWKSASDYLN